MRQLGDRRGVWVVRRKGKGRKFLFALRWRDEDGRLRFETVAESRAAAERARALKMAELDDRGPAGRMNFWRFCGEDVERQRGCCRESTVKLLLGSYIKVVRLISPRTLADIDHAAIEEFRRLRVAEGVRPATVNRDLKALAGGLSRAVERGHLSKNPFAGKRAQLLVPEPKLINQVLSDREVEILLRACPSEDWRGLVLTAYYCGLRLGEALALREVDIDLNGGGLYIRNTPEHQTKSGAERRVPLTAELTAAVRAKLNRRRARRTPGDRERLLWGSTSLRGAKGGRIAAVSAAFATIVKKAGLIEGTGRNLYSFHDLRRTAINRWVKAAMAIDDVMAAAGHKSIETTLKYYTRANTERNHPEIAGHQREMIEIGTRLEA